MVTIEGASSPRTRTRFERIYSAAIAAGLAAVLGLSGIAGYKHAQGEKAVFNGCERRDDIGTIDWVCSTERDVKQVGNPVLFKDNGNFKYRFFVAAVP